MNEELFQLKQQLSYITYTIGNAKDEERDTIQQQFNEEMKSIFKRIEEITNGNS